VHTRLAGTGFGRDVSADRHRPFISPRFDKRLHIKEFAALRTRAERDKWGCSSPASRIAMGSRRIVGSGGAPW
jgi:hypothetical protein